VRIGTARVFHEKAGELIAQGVPCDEYSERPGVTKILNSMARGVSWLASSCGAEPELKMSRRTKTKNGPLPSIGGGPFLF
jgi:hypothetical protein